MGAAYEGYMCTLYGTSPVEPQLAVAGDLHAHAHTISPRGCRRGPPHPAAAALVDVARAAAPPEEDRGQVENGKVLRRFEEGGWL